MRRLAFILLLVIGTNANANPAFEGNWMMDIRPDGAPLEGMLTVERNNGQWQAFVEGGPAPIEIDGDRITVDFDSRDIRGFVFVMRLTGTLAGDRIAGDFEVVADSAVLMKPGTWEAARYTAPERSMDPAPVDLSGTWKPMPGVDLRKYSMVLTPAAQEWYDGYLMHYDQPNVRCVSPGVTAMAAWGGYPFEILDGEDRLTFIYEVDSEVRRVFLDGTEAPEFYPHSGMGFSTGRWEGSTLVMETTHLVANVRDFRGEPVSENAKLVEEYSLSDDGQTLSATMTLYDPENYERPPVRRRKWTASPETMIYPWECDPDSFFRQMYNEGMLDTYFERSKRRF